MEVFNFIPCLLLATSICTSGASTCEHGEMTAMPECAGYRRCVWGNFYDMPCSEGTAWNQDMLRCVHQGSSDDPCTSPSNYLSIGEQCKDQEQDHIAHPTECQLYYDCDVDDDDDDESLYRYAGPVGMVRVEYLKECLYPQLYNQNTSECDDYRNVDCGDRLEIKYVCKYHRHACPVAHCRPCSADAASCEGLEDGFNAHSVKTNSPYYVECKDERWQKDFTCGEDDSGHIMMFDQTTRQCVSHVP